MSFLFLLCFKYSVKFMTLTQERQVVLFKPQGSIDLDSGTVLSE
ncbi:MAG: anti-anti-sigma factor, partial [Aphanizomenon sp.]